MIQSIRTTLPSINDIKNVDYIQSKTKADKFAQIISEHTQVKENNENNFALKENDKFIDSNETIEIISDEIDKYTSTPKESEFNPNKLSFPANTKTTAHKFVQQLKAEEYSPSEFNEISFVEIDDSKKLKTPSLLPKVSISNINELTLKKDVINNINQLNLPKGLINKIISSFNEKNKTNSIGDISNSNSNDVTNDLLGDIIRERTLELINNAEELEALLNLDIPNDTLKAQVSFFEKLRSINLELDKALNENYKKIDSLKNDSKVDIKIKRFDVRELKNFTNKKI
ncbi:MAG: hypothetical protein U0354_01880 [Candidatus Sericytochromatia bacterium]